MLAGGRGAACKILPENGWLNDGLTYFMPAKSYTSLGLVEGFVESFRRFNPPAVLGV